MAHWLTKDNAYKFLLEIIDPPVILLIKNPYLSIESKIKILLISTNRKNRISLNKFLFPFIPRQKNKISKTQQPSLSRNSRADNFRGNFCNGSKNSPKEKQKIPGLSRFSFWRFDYV
jgi:hypothetical protein